MQHPHRTGSRISAGQAIPLAIRPNDLAARLGVTTRHLYNLMEHEDLEMRLPRPFRLGRAVAWKFTDIEAWLDRQAARSPS